MMSTNILVPAICAAGMLVPSLIVSIFGNGPQRGTSIGERFHEQTSLSRVHSPMGEARVRIEKPPPFKEYPGVRVINLPSPRFRGLTVEEALTGRRSVRSYSKSQLSQESLSQLLYAAQGISGERSGFQLRTAPSAGALYPFEIYVVVNDVEGIAQGLYHYNIRRHGLEIVREGDFRRDIRRTGLDQQSMGEADVVFVLTAIVDRARVKYGERGYRYVYMEAGHISQNIALQAVSLGLGSVCAGAFYDDELNTFVGIDGVSEFSVYLHPVGTLQEKGE